MKLGEMLDALFRLTKRQKTEYADALYYSPSEISKYLSGERLPPAQRAAEFIDKSAAFFAETFWSTGTVGSLHEVFPIMRDVESKEQLVSFLGHALHYAYSESQPHAEPVHFGFTRYEVVLQGAESISNHILISMSNAIRKNRETTVQMSLLFFLHYMSRPADRFGTIEEGKRINVRIMLNSLKVKQLLTLDTLIKLITRLQTCDRAVNVSLWGEDVAYRQPYFYMANRYLLTVNEFLPDAPYGTRIQDPAYLFQFNISNSRHDTRQISFRGRDIDLANPSLRQLVRDMLDTCEGIFIFGGVGFPIDEDMLESLQADAMARAFTIESTRKLLRMNIPLLISVAALDDFSANREISIPFLGKLKFNEEQASAYIRGVVDEARKHKGMQIHLTRHSTHPFCLFVVKENVLVYSPPTQTQEESFILLPRDVCGLLLKDMYDILENHSIPLNDDLVNHFLEALPILHGKSFTESWKHTNSR